MVYILNRFLVLNSGSAYPLFKGFLFDQVKSIIGYLINLVLQFEG